MDGMTSQDCVQLFRDLETARSPWLEAWRENARYCQPRRHFDLSHMGAGVASQSTPDLATAAELFDSTGGQALFTLATGMFAWTTPRSKPWMRFGAPPELEGSEVVRTKLDDCTERTRRALRMSNFYTKIFELQLDRSCFGTACLGRVWQDGQFKFTVERDFVCSEGGDEEIDLVIIRRVYSHRQAAKVFGLDNLPDAVRKCATDPKKWHEANEYIHACYPNEEYNPESPLAKHFEFVSTWIHLDSAKEVTRGGSHYNPYIVTRFLTWSGMDPKAPYGWSPAFMAVPDLRQLNRLEMLQDALVDLQMNPRVLVPHDLVGRVDYRPKGVTVIPETGSKPEEWLSGARYDFGVDRAETKRGRIREAFMNDLFKVFSQLDRPQMTAAEVYAILGERLDNASPTFDLYHIDVLEPLGKWAFEMQARDGVFGEFPREMLVETPQGATIPIPEIDFLSRIAIETQAAQEQSALQALSQLLPLAEFDPEVAMQFNLPEFSRRFFTGVGSSNDLLRDPAEIRRMQAAMQRQAMLMQAQEQAA
jgi:hypothetical protein